MEEKKRNMVVEMEALKTDEDLLYLDEAFCTYILDQVNYAKVKAEQIEHLVEGFKEKTGNLPAGMIPSHDLINEFSKALNFLEKAHTRLSIELVRLKSMQMVQEGLVSPAMEPTQKGSEPFRDMSVV